MPDGEGPGGDEPDPRLDSDTRRRLLASFGAIGTSALAGCAGNDDERTATTTNAETPTMDTQDESDDGEDATNETGSTAGAPRVTYYHVDDYGADPTGEEPADGALEDAVAAADPGDWIALTNGHYLLEEYHTFADPYTIDADGSTLECTQYNGDKSSFSQGSLHDSFEAVFHFQGSIERGVAIASPASEGDDQLTVSDASIFEPGDDIVVGSSGPGHRGYEPTRSVVRAVVDDTLHLHTPLKYDYEESRTSMSTDVKKIDAVVRPRVLNARFTGDAGCHVSFEYTREARAEECVVDGFRQHTFQVVNGLDTAFVDCRARNPLNLHGSHGEPFRIVGSSDVNLVRPSVDGCRRGIDLRSGCKTLRVLDPQIRGATLHGICFHNSSDTTVPGKIHVRGGQVSCRLADSTLSDSPRRAPEVQTGWAVSTSEKGEVRLEDVDIIGRRRGLHMREQASDEGYSSKLFVENCSISMVGDDGSGPAIRVRGGEVVLDNVRVDNDGDAKTAAIDVEGANVDISGTIRGNYRDNVVEVRNAENVDLDVDILGWSGGAGAGILVEGGSDGDETGSGTPVKNVSITGSIEGPGRGVDLLRSGIRNVTVDGLTTAVDTEPAISSHRFGDADDVRGVRILDCSTTGGDASTIEIGSPDVDGVWIKNCVHGGITAPDGADVFLRDNLER